jgi:hypothetical protein
MAKTVYITNEQFENLKKSVIKEEEENDRQIAVPLIDEPEDLNKPAKTLFTEFEKEMSAKGLTGKVKPVVPQTTLDAQRLTQMNLKCSKIFTKGQIEEAKINKIVKNSPNYSKTDFQKKFF